MQTIKLKPVKKMNDRHAIVCCVVFLFSILYAGNVLATVYYVNNTTDGNALNQLRGTIVAVDGVGPGPHTINVAAGTYTLTLGQFTFGNNPQTISIIGASAATNMISMTAGAGRDRIFFINPTFATNSPIISVSGLTFLYGSLTSDPFGGADICAGIGSNESLAVTNFVFTNNFVPANAYEGGAFCMQIRVDLTVATCTFINNISNDIEGGAILFNIFGSGLATGFGTLNITNSTFTRAVKHNSRFSTRKNFLSSIISLLLLPY